jgi:ABC-type Fe3+/spermidine/putrescine transport system ATPase subunit
MCATSSRIERASILPGEIMEAPRNEFVARFVKSQNMFDGVSDGSTINLPKI